MLSQVYIRADGNYDIGLGHIVRCLALSYMLREEFQIHFICNSISENILKEIKSAGFLFTKIQNEKEFLEILVPGDIVVLDHYELDSDYQKKVKVKGCKLICIDDLHKKYFFADLIVNHAPGIQALDYKTEPYTQFALGLDYVLLRPEFLAATQNKRIKRKHGSLLICFGGSDPLNLTKRCLQVVTDSKKFKQIIVIIGEAYINKESLEEVIKKENNVQLHHSIKANKMRELMQLAEVSIVPASGVLLEAMSTGCKVISGKYVDNQQYIYSQYKDINAFIDAKDFSVEALNNALNMLKDEFPEKKLIHIDGFSGNRLLKLFLQLRRENYICLRNATVDDTHLTFNWAKDKRIRTYSFSQAEILKEEHILWFNSKLNSNHCLYYIAEFQNQTIGSIRFDVNDNIATISYLVDPAFHGKGFGVSLLKMGIEKLILDNDKNRVDTIIGYVMSDNVPSAKAFERLGFKREVNGIDLKFSKHIYN